MLDATEPLIRLANVEIDVQRESVRRDGVESQLRHRTFQVLLYLIEHHDRDVSKGELFEAVWHGVAVTEDTLVQSIVEIRKALGDDSREPRFVRTLPRFGYRLIAPPDARAVRETEVESTHKLEISIEEETADWRHYLPHLVLALAVLVGGAVAALWVLRDSGSVEAAHRPGADRMTDNLEAYEAFRRGVAAADGLRNREAIESLERAIALDPGFAMAYARIGYAHGVTGANPELARPWFAKALSLPDRLSDVERLHVLGWKAIADLDYPRAIDHFRLLVTRTPTDVDAYHRLGKLLIAEERLAEAVDMLSRGLLVDAGAPELHNAVGTAYSYMGRHDEAIQHHQRYVELRPQEPNTYDSLGLSYQWAGSYDDALRQYDEALRISPRFEVARVHRANTYWQLGRNREAAREYSTYIATAPTATDRARGWSEVAMMRRTLGDIEGEAQAIGEMSRAMDGVELYELLLAADRGGAALASLSSRPPPSVTPGRGGRNTVRLPSFVHSVVARARGDEPQAVSLARETVRRMPPPYLADDFEDTLGDTLAAFGRHSEAIDEYRRVLRINPNRGRTRYKLARSLDSAGRITEAREEYGEFLRIWSGADSDAPEIVAARSRLVQLPAQHVNR